MHLAVGPRARSIAYLALSINSYLETQALGRFSLGYGRLGPTEARLALIALLGGGGAGRATVSRAGGLTLLDLVALGGAAVMMLALAVRAARQPARAGRAASPITVP